MKKRKPFRFKQFEVTQEGGCMPVTTDACIFGALADIGNAKSVLDIGTGTGLLSLLLAQRFPEANFTAIDIDEESVKQANQNFRNSPWKERLQGITADIRTWEPEKRYDTIICNPPFFNNQLLSESENKRRARHTVTLNFEILLDKIKVILNKNGICWIMIPNLHKDFFYLLLKQRSLSILHEINIKSYSNFEPHTVLLCINKKVGSPIHEDVVIYEKPGLYTGKINYLMQYFYLH